MDVHACLWISMDIHGYPWICIDIHTTNTQFACLCTEQPGETSASNPEKSRSERPGNPFLKGDLTCVTILLGFGGNSDGRKRSRHRLRFDSTHFRKHLFQEILENQALHVLLYFLIAILLQDSRKLFATSQKHQFY